LIFDTAARFAAIQQENSEQLFFGDSNFWELGYIPVLQSFIRILRASLVQIDTEMTEKYCNQCYAVN